MQIHAGTSGFSYPAWRGSFYPEDLAAKDMLRFYAERLPAVEINNTFYRLPKASVLAGWAEQVPPGFRFVIKASRRITHFKRLKGTDDETGFLLESCQALGDRLGALLFQLPPQLAADSERLAGFLALLPEGTPAAFEFRHASWQEDAAVVRQLAERGFATCLADTEETPVEALAGSGRLGYLRLRRADYDESDLAAWVERVLAAAHDEVFVFFKHEDAGAGPRLAGRFLELVAERQRSRAPRKARAPERRRRPAGEVG